MIPRHHYHTHRRGYRLAEPAGQVASSILLGTLLGTGLLVAVALIIRGAAVL